jgi:hypothetical protein
MPSIKYLKDIPEGRSVDIPVFGNVTVKSSILTLLSLALPIIWVIFRQTNNIWVLQDILGAALILGVLRTVHLPNLKIAVALLTVFFFYDIFFVFITPLFTKDGKSIMVKVATGGDNHQEMLPLTIVLPHFVDVYEGVCGSQFSILGYGDIIMPGFAISLCLAFDNFYRTKIYFYTSIFAYILGLGLCYVALLLMESAQPALLYLVPCVLGSILLVGWRRGELKALWKGSATTLKTEDEESSNHSHKDANEQSSSEHAPLIEGDTGSTTNEIVELEDVLDTNQTKNQS